LTEAQNNDYPGRDCSMFPRNIKAQENKFKFLNPVVKIKEYKVK